jgi:transcriptional regulator with XRE-family HTH domain
MNKDTMDFAEAILNVRTSLRISQQELAADLQVSYATVNRWENRRTVPNKMTLNVIKHYCHSNHLEFDYKPDNDGYWALPRLAKDKIMLLPDSLLALIQQGEGLNVEFKRSAMEITSDVYETVCSFSNREGGHIFLGVKDNGEILGVQKDRVDQMKKNFVTAINNRNKINPPLYINPIDYEFEGKTIIMSPEGRTEKNKK